jgi:PiT family inorganic phosphate transporter
MWPLLSCLFMGWALGANDAANVFGTAVTVGVVRFRTAAFVGAIAVLAGAVLEGAAGINTIGNISQQTAASAGIIALAAALSVSVMTILHFPVSTSQAVVGAIAGAGVMQGVASFQGMEKLVICWVVTPIGAAMVSLLLFWMIGRPLSRMPISILTRDRWLWNGVVVAGAYGAYALGANNVANVTGVFVGAGVMTPMVGALAGGSAIALGMITFGKGVMTTVGSGLVRLDAFTALVVILSEALTVHTFAMIGVPVSATQAVVGAVLGVGWAHGNQSVRIDLLGKILAAWVGTPAVSFLVAAGVHAILS